MDTTGVSDNPLRFYPDGAESVVCEMGEELGYSAATLAGWTKVPIKTVRIIQRKLHADGLAEFGFLMTEDDGKLAGRGYWLSKGGVELRRQLGA